MIKSWILNVDTWPLQEKDTPRSVFFFLFYFYWHILHHLSVFLLIYFLEFITLTLNPTAKKPSGHISGQVQDPNCSPLVTFSTDLCCRSLKASPARSKYTFSPNPLDSSASRAVAISRVVMTTEESVYQLWDGAAMVRAQTFINLLLVLKLQASWIIYRETWERAAAAGERSASTEPQRFFHFCFPFQTLQFAGVQLEARGSKPAHHHCPLRGLEGRVIVLK